MTPILTPILIYTAPLAMLVCGFTVLFANPKRTVNRSVFMLTAHVSLWLLLRELSSLYAPSTILFRICITSGTLLLIHLAYVVDVIITNSWKVRSWKFILVSIICLAASLLPWFDAFAQPAGIQSLESHGVLYLVYIIMLLISLSYLAVSTVVRISRLDRRVGREIKAIIYPATAVGVVILVLMLLRRISPLAIPRATSSILIIYLSISLSYSISKTSLFGAKNFIKMPFLAMVLIMLSLLAVIFALNIFRDGLIIQRSTVVYCVISMFAAIIFAIVAIERCFLLCKRESIKRSNIYQLLERCESEDRITTLLAQTIGGWTKSELTIFCLPLGAEDEYNNFRVKPDNEVISVLSKCGVLTPEIIRRKEFVETKTLLSTYFDRYQLGAMVMSVGSNTPVIFALAERENLKPFTSREAHNLSNMHRWPGSQLLEYGLFLSLLIQIDLLRWASLVQALRTKFGIRYLLSKPLLTCCLLITTGQNSGNSFQEWSARRLHVSMNSSRIC